MAVSQLRSHQRWDRESPRLQPSLTRSAASIEYAQTRIVSLFTSWQVSTMTFPISLSAAAKRTNPSSISHLMQTALENPGIVSLAAGFVDQRSLPVEMVARAAADLFDDPMEGRRSLQYGTTSAT